MPSSAPWSSLSATECAAAIAQRIAAGHDVAWLDGGSEGRGVVGFDCDLALESDDADAIDAVDRLWQRSPDAVWIGCLSYDFAADLVLGRMPRRRALPGLILRRYRSGLELLPGGAVRQRGTPPPPEAASSPAAHDTAWPLVPLVPLWTAEHYRAQVAAAQAFITAGDTYQVNLAQRFFAPWQQPCRPSELPGRAASVYLQLRARAPAERGALLPVPGGFVLSNSPETLVDVERDAAGVAVAHARPIKGTRPRASTDVADRAAREELRLSAKDRAEHVMIVDLVRSDLGRLARTGSVHAPAQPTELALPTVHHLVTEIRATLRDDVGLADLCAALVPGGSVTGAPKRRTIEIIEALEQHPRGIYCGAIILLEPTGLRMSIPIRTAMLTAGGLALHAGGGIVIDSDPEAERLESIAKTRAFAG